MAGEPAIVMNKEPEFMNDGQRQELIERLFAERCSCVIRHGAEMRLFRERGVKDLYRLLLEEPEFLRGAFVADKVVGKAAAALMVLGGVREVFAGVLSRGAYDLLSRVSIRLEYRLLVPHIINRAQTDWCPLEKRCADVQTPEACRVQIEDFIAMISKSNNR